MTLVEGASGMRGPEIRQAAPGLASPVSAALRRRGRRAFRRSALHHACVREEENEGTLGARSKPSGESFGF